MRAKEKARAGHASALAHDDWLELFFLLEARPDLLGLGTIGVAPDLNLVVLHRAGRGKQYEGRVAFPIQSLNHRIRRATIRQRDDLHGPDTRLA